MWRCFHFFFMIPLQEAKKGEKLVDTSLEKMQVWAGRRKGILWNSLESMEIKYLAKGCSGCIWLKLRGVRIRFAISGANIPNMCYAYQGSFFVKREYESSQRRVAFSKESKERKNNQKTCSIIIKRSSNYFQEVNMST